MADDSDEAILRRMMRNFKLSSQAEDDNRKRGLRALKFRRGGEDQWDKGVYDMFGGLNKPRDSFNQVPQFVHQVTNDMRMNMPQIRFTAADDGDDKVADLMEDIMREIQSTSDAEVAYDTATDSQVTIGWGYFRFITRYMNSTSKHQDIVIRWVPNPFKVYDDPNASMQDFSDRSFLFEVSDVEVEAANDDYNLEYDDSKLESIGDSQPDWADAQNKLVRVAEYWEVRNRHKTIYFDDQGNLTEDETKDSREVNEPEVWWYKATAEDIIDRRKWEGKYIPYVRVNGETLHIDGKVYYLGLVDSMIPVQKQYNYFMNNASYKTTLPPISPWLLDPEQIEGYESFWQRQNIDPTPFLPVRIYKDGKQYPSPQRADNSTNLSTDMAMIQQAQQNFYACTGIYPASLGQESNEKSGKAIMARQKEGDVSTFHFPDNFARALRCGGRIAEDLIHKVYDGSRVISAQKEDGTKYKATVNQDHKDEFGNTVHFDLTKGNYSVNVTTGPSYSTKKMEAADQATQLIQSFPAIMQTPAGPQLIRSMDLVQADMIADGLEAALPPQFQSPPELKDLPDNVKRIVQQGMQTIQGLEQQLEQAHQIIQQGGQELQQAQQAAADKSADSQFKLMDGQAKAADADRKHQYDMANLALQQAKLEQDGQFRAQEIALKDKALNIQALSLGLQADQAQMAMDNAVIDKAMDQAHELTMQEADQDHDHAQAVVGALLQPQQHLDNTQNVADNSNQQQV